MHAPLSDLYSVLSVAHNIVAAPGSMALAATPGSPLQQCLVLDAYFLIGEAAPGGEVAVLAVWLAACQRVDRQLYVVAGRVYRASTGLLAAQATGPAHGLGCSHAFCSFSAAGMGFVLPLALLAALQAHERCLAHRSRQAAAASGAAPEPQQAAPPQWALGTWLWTLYIQLCLAWHGSQLFLAAWRRWAALP